MKHKTIILTVLSTIISYTAESAEQCTIERNIYEVSMKYVDDDDLANSRLPLREKFNLNEEDPEDQALKYQDKNDDIIITINKKFYKERWSLLSEDKIIQILDDTGLYTSHFLIQGLIELALEYGEIKFDPNDDKYKKQVTIIKKQLKKLKAVINKVATRNFDDLFENGKKDAEDVEDNIGNEWLEEAGVLDILDNTPVHIAQLSVMWTILMQNISKASDIQLQAFQRTKQATDDIQESELYSTWNTLSVPKEWKYTSPESLVPIFFINVSHSHRRIGLGFTQEQSTILEEAYATLNHQRGGNNNYNVPTTGPLKALVLDKSKEHCSYLNINPHIIGQPRRSTMERLKQYLTEIF